MPAVLQGGKAGPDRVGQLLLALKDHLVSSGWTVRGSGDGLTRHGDIVADEVLPSGERGSGGLYDCWSVDDPGGSVDGSPGNQDAWCWLRSPAGVRDVLLTASTSATVQNGRVGFTREDATGFVGGSTDPTTMPTAPVEGSSYEYWSIGSRASAGGLHSNTTADVFFTAVVSDDGEEWVYFVSQDASGVITHSQGFAGCMSVINPHPDDPDPWIYARLRFNITQQTSWWDWVDSAWENTTEEGGNTPVFSATTGAYTNGTQVIFRGSSGSQTPKGQISFMVWLPTAPSFGDRFTDQETGKVYLAPDANGAFNSVVLWSAGEDHELAPSPTDHDLFIVGQQTTTPEADPPQVTVVSPPAGSVVQADTPFVVRVTDAGSGLGLTALFVGFPGLGSNDEAIWVSGLGARPGYSVTVSAITDGSEFTITRDAGWIGSPTFYVAASDGSGNQL